MSRRCKSSIWAQFSDNFWKNTFLLNLPPLPKSWSISRFAGDQRRVQEWFCREKMRFSWLEWTTNMLLTERTVRAHDWTPATDLFPIITTIFMCDSLMRSPLSYHQRMRRHQINLTSLVVARRHNYHSWCIMWRTDKRHYATVCFGSHHWGLFQYRWFVWRRLCSMGKSTDIFCWRSDGSPCMMKMIFPSIDELKHESLLYSSDSRTLDITSIIFSK